MNIFKLLFIMYLVMNGIGYAHIGSGQNDEVDAQLPEGHAGIAAEYIGDEGIENDPDVLFVENFEENSLNQMWNRWESVSHRENMAFGTDVPGKSAGRQSFIIERTKGSGAHLYRRIKNEAGGWGVDTLFARFYVKFAHECGELHHFGTHIGGYNPSTPWPQGGAGERPDGNKRFTIGVEPYGSSWTWDFYSYWQGMHVHGDGNYWGTPFMHGVSKPKVEKGEWICVEIMVKMNDPVDASNGEMAFWIDGKLHRRDGQVVNHIGPGFPKGRWTGGWWSPSTNTDNTFEGFAWRSVEALKANYVWLYVYTSKPAGHWIKVWFDDVVLAKKYIGPLHGRDDPIDKPSGMKADWMGH